MRRREFITLLGGATAAWPLAARAQSPGGRVYRIGILGATSLRAAEGFLNAFRDGMRERGYVEDQNLAIEYRAPAAPSEQNRDLAADLVRGGYDVILAWTTPSVIAARRATSTVPVVFVGVADPVGLGLVAGLARPGANVTGIANFASDLSGKMIELLREIVPGARRLGAVRNPDNPASQSSFASWWMRRARWDSSFRSSMPACPPSSKPSSRSCAKVGSTAW
jgi:putative ABC transport system substrate-binding protein